MIATLRNVRATAALATAALAVAIAACGAGGEPRALPDSSQGPDGVGGGAVPLPTWKLEDIQPQSPRVGQTYGLDTFAGKIVVVTLVEGF